jgi:hypothetical protein
VLKKISLVALICAVAVFAAFYAIVGNPQRHSVPRPLSKSELLALVAGQSRQENIVSEIRTYGLLLTPTTKYKSLLETAGADPRILSALTDAKITPGKQPDPADDSSLLSTPDQSREIAEHGPA